jgi:hypothetical protein
MCSSRWAIPASPYPSCREPTKTVRFTVTVGFDESGYNSTCRPLSSRYSVIPSIVTSSSNSSAGTSPIPVVNNPTSITGTPRDLDLRIAKPFFTFGPSRIRENSDLSSPPSKWRGFGSPSHLPAGDPTKRYMIEFSGPAVNRVQLGAARR